MTTLLADKVVFYSSNDEDAFFRWLRSIPCVLEFKGVGTNLYIEVSDEMLTEVAGRDIVALFFRYGVDIEQLSKVPYFGRSKWFRNPQAYWNVSIARKER